ncbi:MAG: T9SS type A sorting domain-containing protein [Flavobacteriales bacterium]|nr:T9SS type A sorting domain-containing protein [Flavobacteriales bacterium]
MKTLLSLISLLCAVSVSAQLAQTGYALVDEWSEGYYVDGSFGTMPSTVLDNMIPHLAVANFGDEVQQGVQLQFSIDGAVMGLSDPIDLAPGQHDTLSVEIPMTLNPGQYLADLTVISQSMDNDPSDNSITRPFHITEYDLGRDHGEVNSLYPEIPPSSGEQFYASYTLVPEDITAYGMRVALAGGIPYSEVKVKVYSQWNEIVAVGSTLLNPEDLNETDISIDEVKWIDIAFDEVVELSPYQIYYTGVETDGNSQLQVLRAISHDWIDGVYFEEDGNNWVPDDVVMVRVSFDPDFETQELWGCTDSEACNYDPMLLEDEGICLYPEEFYDCAENCLSDVDNDGVCDELEVLGCTNPEAENYDPLATDDDGSCYGMPVYGCTQDFYVEYNPEANIDDGSCLVWLYGETLVLNFQSESDSISFRMENPADGYGYDCCWGGWDNARYFQWNPDSCYRITMYDSGGDGWENSTLQLYSSGDLMLETSLEDGFEEEFYYGLFGPCVYSEYDGPMYELTDEETVEYGLFGPNPTDNFGTVQWRNLTPDEFVYVSVFDNAGRKVKETQVVASGAGEIQFQLNLSDLETGIYQMVLHQGEHLETERIIKK